MNFKDTVGWTVLSRFSQWKILGFIFLFDFLFLICLYAAATLFDVVFGIFGTVFVGSFVGFIALFVYFAAVASAYCFFKYCMFEFLDAFAGKRQRVDFGRFRGFWMYNFVVLLILVVLYVAGLLFMDVGLVDFFKEGASTLYNLILLVFGYLFVQTSHVVFLKTKVRLRGIPKKVWSLLSWRLVVPWLMWNTLFVVVLGVGFAVLLGVMGFLQQMILANPNLMTVWYIVNVLMFCYIVVAVYFLAVYNRLYLYIRVQRALKEKLH